LKVLFSRDIPSIVRKCLLPSLEAFLNEQGVPLKSIRHLVAHPGGAKVIEAYEETLGLASEQMNHPREVLRRYGNMSSPTVLFVLREFLRSEEIHRSEYGLVTALGPGFSSEMLLLQG
jgi:alkylresorcinol/alkylpyrone synthase